MLEKRKNVAHEEATEGACEENERASYNRDADNLAESIKAERQQSGCQCGGCCNCEKNNS